MSRTLQFQLSTPHGPGFPPDTTQPVRHIRTRREPERASLLLPPPPYGRVWVHVG